jgi:methionyl-tRNA formyltransferase
MVKVVTFGYRWEGLALHQWAFTHTELQTVVLPGNRLPYSQVTDMVTSWAEWFKVPLLWQTTEDSQEFIGQLKEYKPDIILCHCYSYKLVKDILKLPSLGCVNIHPGKLPEYRGKNPIQAAFDKNEATFWATIHYMDEGLDTGPVIAEAPVARGNNIEETRSELTKTGLILLEKEWEKITKTKR